MSQPTRPALKLKLPSMRVPSAPTEPPATTTPKIKLKLGNPSKPSTPSEAPANASGGAPATKEKKHRKPREKKDKAAPSEPSTSPPKKTTKKRPRPAETDDDAAAAEEAEPVALPTPTLKLTVPAQKPAIKKIKLTARPPITPIIRPKFKGKAPPRPPGVGYDSEASDREEDPAIEEEFILRMMPGEDCDYLRKAIEERKIGLPIREGGADVWMKFFTREGRRAVISIRGRLYAGAIVDLPCVIEAMKSWDRRGWWKSADVCQMLLVTGPVANEDAALTAPVPDVVDQKTWQYPHGLTPPMYNARRRRFRKRISNRTIEAVEDEVERLLEADSKTEDGGVSFEYVDMDRITRDNSVARESENGDGGYDMLGSGGMAGRQQNDDDDIEEDADGDVDEDAQGYFNQDVADHNEGLEEDLEMAMMADSDDDGEGAEPDTTATAQATTTTNGHHLPTTTNTAATAGTTGLTPSVGTPVTATHTTDHSSSSDASSDEDDDDDGSQRDGAEFDDEALERAQDLQRQREEIADLEAEITRKTSELAALKNPLLRVKISKMIQSLRADLDVKRMGIRELEGGGEGGGGGGEGDGA